MLALDVVLEIRRLLDEGELSQRKIAAKLDVSRGVVGAISTGRRELKGRSSQFPLAWGDDRGPCVGDYFGGALPRRCRGCGGMVYMPCMLCRARACRRGRR